MRTPMIVAMALLAMSAAGTALADEQKPGAQQPKAKPGVVVSCDAIVEMYKHAKSVDKVADQFMVDESRVTACLKNAGITAPNDDLDAE